MTGILKKLLFLLFFTLTSHCAKEDPLSFYSTSPELESGIKNKERFLTCNIISDDTFKGKIFVKNNYANEENCFLIEIYESASHLFSTDFRLLQIYTLQINENEDVIGKSLDLRIHKKGSDVLEIFAQVIDKNLIENRLKSTSDSFFLDHDIYVCGIRSAWNALQITLYEENSIQKTSTPLRNTKFILPPFIFDPNEFEKENGISVLAYHPFLLIKDSPDLDEYTSISNKDICSN